MALAARGLRQPNPCYGAGGSEGVPLGGAPDERDDLENFELNQASERGDEGEPFDRLMVLSSVEGDPFRAGNLDSRFPKFPQFLHKKQPAQHRNPVQEGLPLQMVVFVLKDA